MYRGNMYDFCQKLNDYLRREYDMKLVFGKSSLGYYVALFTPDMDSAVAYQVFDTENFEKQIYDYINKELEDVQIQHDGLPEQPNNVFGEEI